MHWDYKIDARALKELARLDRHTQKEFFRYCDKRLRGDIRPRAFGHALTGEYRGLWRYRFGDCRLICEIKDRELIVLVLAVGHRREIYR